MLDGRLVYIQTKNLVTETLTNWFSVYGKSNENRDYANSLIDKLDNEIEQNSLENLIICGDFNFVTSTNDRNTNSYTQTDNNYRTKWNVFEVKNDLIDCFRKICPKRRLYTFSQTGGNSKSRIDRVYISGCNIGRVQKIDFENNQESDHKLVRVKMVKEIEIGRGTWMFNNSMLNEATYTDEAEKIVKSYTQENQRFSFPNNRITWDFLKSNVSNFSKKFSKDKARKERKEIDIIKNKLEILESMPKEKINRDVENEILRLKKIEWDYNEKKLKGFKIRSRIPYMEEGEGSISYFANLEKRKGEENLIFSLENDDGEVQEGNENIRKTVFDFFSNLYSEEPVMEDLQDELLQHVDKFLTNEEKISLDKAISREEIYFALNKLPKDKTPGPDGLSSEFLKNFWSDLGELYQKVIEEIHEFGELTESQKKGLIKISHKKNGRQFLKNNRPITLLNTDLKLITKISAIRLAKVLKNIIHDSQKCVI